MKVSVSALASALTLSAIQPSMAASYDVMVPPAAYEFAAYSFAQSAITNALGSVPTNTSVLTWTGYSWAQNTFNDGFGWDNPNQVLNPGEGFFIYNPTPTNRAYRIYGTALTSSSYYLNLPTTNVWYSLGSAYPLSLSGTNYLECTGSNYMWTSLNYHAHVADKVQLWNASSQSWSTSTRSTNYDGSPLWIGQPGPLSPVIAWNGTNVGRGFLLMPAATNTWINLRSGASCR